MARVTPEHVEARRRQLLRGALHCFARKGIHGTSIKEIAEQAGLSVGTVYSYFSNKDEVVEAIAEFSAQAASGLLPVEDPEGDPLEAILQLANEFVSRLRTEEGRLRARLGIALWAEELGNERIRSLFAPAANMIAARFTDALRAGQTGGTVRSDLEASAMAWRLIGFFESLLLQVGLRETVDLRGQTEVFRVLLQGLATDSPAAGQERT